MNISFVVLISIIVILMVLGLIGFFMDTIQHNRWLNEQEKKWRDGTWRKEKED